MHLGWIIAIEMKIVLLRALPYSLAFVFLLESNQLSYPKHFVEKLHRTITLPDTIKKTTISLCY